MAHKDAASLGKLFKGDRKKLLTDPKTAVSEAGAPAELGVFLASLSRGERHVLIDTWDHMSEKSFTTDVDGVTVAFL